MNQEQIKRLEDIMDKFGKAHTLLAKTKLPPKEYQPISSLLASGKVGLFNLYREIKK